MKTKFKKIDKNRVYTYEERMSVAMAYLAETSSKKLELYTGIPARTIRHWVKSDWFHEYLETAKSRYNKQLDANFTKIIHKVADEVMDRVMNGDEVVGRSGMIVKKKVTAKDLATIMGIISDKRAMLRGEPVSRRETVSTEDRLKKLRDGLTEVAEGKKEVKEDEHSPDSKVH